MKDFSQILLEAYQQFVLNVEGKSVPISYRINIPPIEHPARQGKSAPEVILKQLYEDAKEQNFDLKSASVEEIQEFMNKNNLGLDCSGFVYRMLDILVQEVKGKNLQDFGFPHVGRTNVNVLTSDEFSEPVQNFKDLVAGDLVKIDSESNIPHVILVIDYKDGEITFAHSSRFNNPAGIYLGKAKIENILEEFPKMSYNIEAGDDIRRLKILI